MIQSSANPISGERGEYHHDLRKWCKYHRLEAKLAANQKIDEVKRLSDIGVPKTRIAKELGISVRTVHRYLSSLKPVIEQEKVPAPASKPFAHTGGTSREKREARKREIEQLVSADLAALQPTPDDD